MFKKKKEERNIEEREKSYIEDWVIDFNGISNQQGLFYVERLGNRFYCI